MKELLLLRHAKSSWDDDALADFDRPLARRGRAAAPLIGRAIAQRRWMPELALVSPAARTRETWDLAGAQLDPRPAEAFVPALYGATAEALLAQIRKVPETVSALLVIGHNPGLEELAAGLAGEGSDGTALAALGEKFPTAALARFEFPGSWADLGSGGARLSHFLRPADLA